VSASPDRRDTHLRELKAAKADFEHQLRRYSDAAERQGRLLGPDAADVRRLKQNLADTDAEIARLQAGDQT